VSTPREAALDTEFLSVASTLGVERSVRLTAGFSAYNTFEYVSKIKTLWTNEEELKDDRWTNFWSRFCSKNIRETPKTSFMYGPLQKEIKKRVIKQRAPKEKVGKKVVPKEIVNTNADKKTETTRRVEHVNKCLSSFGQPIGFWRMIVDPNSFTRTVENLFHLSFLVKEGHAKVSEDDTVLPYEPPSDGDFETKRAKRQQTIVKLDFDTWLKVKDELSISEALITPYGEEEENGREMTKSQKGKKRTKDRQTDSGEESEKGKSQKKKRKK